MKIVLLRHGESEWNLQNRFTGWTDVDLTITGIDEAQSSGKKIHDENLKIQTIFTSILKRAIQTTEIVADCISFPLDKVQYDWRLNERHYGALQGLNKSETAKKYGEKQVHIWRRSYNISPPKLSQNDDRHPRFNKNFNSIDQPLPDGESLKDVIERLKPFWRRYFEHILKYDGDHLIVAHSNSLRAIVKILENLSSEEIIDVNIPTGIPLMYNFDSNNSFLDKRYLIDKKTLKAKQNDMINQGSKKL